MRLNSFLWQVILLSLVVFQVKSRFFVRKTRDSTNSSFAHFYGTTRQSKIHMPRSCQPPLRCYNSNIAKDFPPSTPKTALRNHRPRIVQMKPIQSIHLRYQRKVKKPESEDLYKFKTKIAMRNILQRSKSGRLNKIKTRNW